MYSAAEVLRSCRDTSRLVARVLTARAAHKILLQLQETDLFVHRWFGEFCTENPPNQGDDFLLKLMRARTESVHEGMTSARHLINPQVLLLPPPCCVTLSFILHPCSRLHQSELIAWPECTRRLKMQSLYTLTTPVVALHQRLPDEPEV